MTWTYAIAFNMTTTFHLAMLCLWELAFLATFICIGISIERPTMHTMKLMLLTILVFNPLFIALMWVWTMFNILEGLDGPYPFPACEPCNRIEFIPEV